MKYFVVSDIHSCYDAMMKALKEAKFDPNNENHCLIVNGDLFDRGNQSVEVYTYITSLPRCILIRGNHEDLLLECLERPLPHRIDWSNGTVRTICNFTGMDIDAFKGAYFNVTYGWIDADEFDEEKYKNMWKSMVKKFKKLPVYKWLTTHDFKNYIELGPYIITHGFIPLTKPASLDMYDIDPVWLSYNPDWRNAANRDFYESRWGCPWKFYAAGLFKPEADKGKILICGHWWAKDFHTHLGKATKEINTTYQDEHIVAIDGCTPSSGIVNVFTFEA